MLKQISKSDLRLGMYIHDLNCEWLKHPFLRRSFMLRDEADLERIQAGSVGFVWIDTLRGLDAGPEAEAGGEGPAPRTRTSHQEELPIARQILREAQRAAHAALADVRMGRQVRVAHLQPVVQRITGSILRNPGTLVSLCRLREADKATFQHSVSCCALLVLFGHHLGMAEATLQEVGLGGLLHDVGKMRVPDPILNKPDKLTRSEYAIMRDHVRLGLETLGQTPGVTEAVMQVAAEHHERCDGSGYPRRLKEPQISLLGRMAAITDVYDAITSNRIYHRFLEPAAALRWLYQRSPREYDQDLVQHFIQAIGIYPVGSLVRLESDRLAVVVEQHDGGLLRPKVRVVHDLARDQAVEPFDLDLSRPEAQGDGILSHEEPAHWGLDPSSLIP